jgi:hypothetical protein
VKTDGIWGIITALHCGNCQIEGMMREDRVETTEEQESVINDSQPTVTRVDVKEQSEQRVWNNCRIQDR